MQFILRFILLLLSLMISACSAHIASDYPVYLSKNDNSLRFNFNLPESCYYLPKETQNYIYSFRSFTGGYYLTEWDVQFGEIFDATMRSNDIQNVFGKISKMRNPICSSDNLITFKLNDYEFIDCRAKIDLTITVVHSGEKILNKRYYDAGQRQCGKMYWGGGLATRNAVQQSTKDALDVIFLQFIPDMKHAIDNYGRNK